MSSTVVKSMPFKKKGTQAAGAVSSYVYQFCDEFPDRICPAVLAETPAIEGAAAALRENEMWLW